MGQVKQLLMEEQERVQHLVTSFEEANHCSVSGSWGSVSFVLACPSADLARRLGNEINNLGTSAKVINSALFPQDIYVRFV